MITTENNVKTKKTEIELYIISKVRELRESRKIGQQKLSIEIKVDASFVGHAESLKHSAKYNFNHINEFARFFNVPFSYFFPETHVEKDCVEEYMELHPKVKAKYEKQQQKLKEENLKKTEEKERLKEEKAAAKAKAKAKKKK